MKLSHLILLFLIFSCLPVNAIERLVIRIDDPDPSVFRHYLETAADIASYRPGVYLDLVIPASELPAYRALHPALSVTQTEAQLKENLSSLERDIPGYSTYSALMTEIQSLQAQYPSLISTQIIGSGWGYQLAQTIPYYQNFNHQITAIKVSNDVLVEEDEPAIYFCGAHHAREPIGVEVCMEILTYLVENYNLDPFVTNLLNTTQVWIVPLINPDGHKVVLDQTDVWWRKNIRDNNNSQNYTGGEYGYGADGVDINRNYAWEWGYISATDDNNSATYHGPGALSEPEAQAFADFLRSKPFIAGISYHTYGQYVLYPFGYQSNLYAPDETELRLLAESVAAVVGGQQGGFYDPMPSWELYPVSGSLDDWAYGELGIFAYTIEMATEFIPNASAVPQVVQNNLSGALQFLGRRSRALLSGHVLDQETGEPVEAVIHVRGLDDSPVFRNDYKSNLQFGSYYRLLSPGQYTVDYIASGYQTQTVTVSISTTGTTQQDVFLSAMPPASLRLKVVQDANSGLPLEGASLRFPDLEILPLVSDTEGYFYLTDFPAGTYRIELSKDGFDTLFGWYELFWGMTFSLQQGTGFQDGFEEGMANWQTVGAWNLSTQSFAGSGSLTDSPTGNYSNNNESTCRLLNPVNLSAATNVNLQFKAKHTILLDGDYAALEYSVDNITWQALDYFNGNRDWTSFSYNLSGLSDSSIYLRFRMNTNSSGRADGIYIDEFKLFTSYYEPTEADDAVVTPVQISLSAYPNPFSEQLNLEVSYPSGDKGELSLQIFNLKGQQVFGDKISLTQSPRVYSWKGVDSAGKPLSSGIYFVRLQGRDSRAQTKRIMHIK